MPIQAAAFRLKREISTGRIHSEKPASDKEQRKYTQYEIL